MFEKKSLIIWGAAGHALVVANIVILNNKYKLVGFLDDTNRQNSPLTFNGLPVLRGREHLTDLIHNNVRDMIVGIGDCDVRLNLSEVAREKGFRLARVVHPGAIVAADVMVGEGSVIAAGAVINPNVKIGENVIVNTSASIDHECEIDDGVHISPGVHLAGRVQVGRATWVGIGAVVADRVQIGSQTIIGAGAVVVNNIPDGVVAYGIPAKVMKKRLSSER